MAKINNGGPAFPRMGGYVEGTIPLQWEPPQAGMSLRDWFAGQALVGQMTAGESDNPAGYAELAYAVADAMLAERAKPAATDTNRALIAELVGAIENTLPRLRADTDDPEGIDWSAEIAAFEAVVAKAKSESAP